MKKLFYFAAAAMMMAACTSEELNVKEAQQAVQDNAAVNFDVYTLRGATRAGTPGDIDNANIGEIGFGVFAYYTAGSFYDTNAKPNFMYNQKVTADGVAGADGTKWTYEPVKYWPNEYGDAAASDEIDYVSFFSYAPWTAVEPTTGKPIVTDPRDQNYNIVSVKGNNIAGDPIVQYAVDTDPATSVDLLWGVNADVDGYSPIAENADIQNKAGYPFINLTKPGVPQDAQGGKIKFNLRHALAKVKVTIDYIADDNTPEPTGDEAVVIDPDETRIFVRSFTMNGFAMKGSLNLNNTEFNKPLWKDFQDSSKDLDFSKAITFYDGRKLDKEGTDGGDDAKETPQGLNPEIIENFALTETTDEGKVIFGEDKNYGVRDYKNQQLLFGGDEEENDGYFYVIPREGGEPVDVTIVYDVETIDPSLANKLSDNTTHGSSIENIITKTAIFGEEGDFEAGKQYQIHIHLGMTSVKIEAVVEPWTDGSTGTDVDLPDNQPVDDQQGGGVTPTPTPAPAPATVAEALAATPAITSFKYTIVGGNDADLIGTLTTETFEYTSTVYPERSGTYYRFNRANGTNYVYVKSDAPIDGTTETRVLAQNGTSSLWSIKLAPAD